MSLVLARERIMDPDGIMAYTHRRVENPPLPPIRYLQAQSNSLKIHPLIDRDPGNLSKRHAACELSSEDPFGGRMSFT